MIEFSRKEQTFTNIFLAFDSTFIKFKMIEKNSTTVEYIKFQTILLGIDFALLYANRRKDRQADRRDNDFKWYIFLYKCELT